MSRIEKINKLRELESRKVNFEQALEESENHCVSVFITIFTTSSRYGSEEKNNMEVNKDLFNDYLSREIETLEHDIKKIIGELV